MLRNCGTARVGNEKCTRTFFCTNFLNAARGPGHPSKILGTSQIPPFETQGRQTFEGGHEVFGHHPFQWKTPTPPGGLRTQKVNLRALFSCLKENTSKYQENGHFWSVFLGCFEGIISGSRTFSYFSWRFQAGAISGLCLGAL